MRTYHVDVMDKTGHTFPASGECHKDGTEPTKNEIKEWATKYGHTVYFNTYREFDDKNNPAYVEACLSDIAGFKR